MGNTRFNTTTKTKTLSSGISEQLPAILKYPNFLPFNDHFKGIFCYIIRHYGTDGLSVLIYRQPQHDQVVVLCGDWKGNKLDITNDSPFAKLAHNFVATEMIKFYEMMRLIKIEQAQFFFAVVKDNLILVDVQLSLNKMAGPGMVNDIFGKICPTQEVLKIEILDERAIEQISRGSGAYEGNLIFKPSRFRNYEESGQYQPLISELIR